MFTELLGINNNSSLVGDWVDSQGSSLGALHGLVASSAQLLDPIDTDPSNSLLNGAAVTTDMTALATKGRLVQGVATDGVAQVVVRIPAASAGDQLTVTVINDSLQASQRADQDGAVGKPGDSAFTQPSVNLTAQSVNLPGGGTIPYAFAIYQAPIDFVRTGAGGGFVEGSVRSACPPPPAGAQPTDDQLGCRTVFLRVQNLTRGISADLPVAIIRPPVILIHGLWANEATWTDFAPFNVPISSDGRFASSTVNYDEPVTIVSSSPSYDPSVYSKVLGNALDFQYNALNVLGKIDLAIENFKAGQNPPGISVAAIQADVVAHSMGGDIVRALALQVDFLNAPNFAQGSIHKAITITSPHLGTPLASQLLSGQNNCTLSIFAQLGKFSFSSVVLSDGFTWGGAVGDLQGDGIGGSRSAALQDLDNPLLAQHPLHIALIGATLTTANLSNVGGTVEGSLLRSICVPQNDPLAVALTPTTWEPNVFAGQPTDALVPINSQLDRVNGGLTTTVPAASLFPGSHTPALKVLGFGGPTVLDPGPVPNQVISLLNMTVESPVFNLLNP